MRGMVLIALILIASTYSSFIPKAYTMHPSFLNEAVGGVVESGVHTSFWGYAPASGPPVYIDVVGLYDKTDVWIVDITKAPRLAASGTVDRMKLYTFELFSEMCFKVLASKPVAVSLGGGGAYGFGWNTFYPSVNGSFVGKEFIFMAVPSGYKEHNIFAVEEADVTIYNVTTGEMIFRQVLLEDQYATVRLLPSRRVYHIVSTGKIMVSSWTGNSLTTIPSTTGRFVGRRFFGVTIAWERDSYALFAYEDSNVKVYDLETGEQYAEHNLSKGEYLYQGGIGTKHLLFESTGDISVLCGDTEGGDEIEWMGDDITFAGGKDGKEFWIYAVWGVPGAVIIAWTDTEVKVNGTLYRLKADQYIKLKPQSFYHIVANKEIFVEILGLDGTWNDWGTYLISYPWVTGGSPPAEELPIWVYVAAGGGVIAAALIVRRRRKTRMRRRLHHMPKDI